MAVIELIEGLTKTGGPIIHDHMAFRTFGVGHARSRTCNLRHLARMLRHIILSGMFQTSMVNAGAQVWVRLPVAGVHGQPLHQFRGADVPQQKGEASLSRQE